VLLKCLHFFDELAQVAHVVIAILMEIVLMLVTFTNQAEVVIQRLLRNLKFLRCGLQLLALVVAFVVKVAIVKSAPLFDLVDDEA